MHSHAGAWERAGLGVWERVGVGVGVWERVGRCVGAAEVAVRLVTCSGWGLAIALMANGRL